jgi:hemerythrin
MSNQIKAVNAGISPKDAFEMLEAERSQSPANELLDVFDALLKNISLSHQRLQEINLTLEQRVEQTDRANKQLSILNISLEELSFKDVLTGIPNRRYAIKYLSSAWELAQTINQSISCVVIDTDFFKEVNDNYGHDVGDVVLIKLTKALNKNFRDKDIVCRLGGDEFLVILPDTDIKTAMKVAERVRANIAKMKIKTGGKPWVGSISVGVASKDKSMKSFEQLIKKADEAVYFAKQNGKNCVKCVE